VRPRDAKTEEDVCRLQADNYPSDPNRLGSILIDGPTVRLYGWVDGGKVVSVSMPRKDFIRIVDWYQRDQVERTKP